MSKPYLEAKRDITYCVNKECKQRAKCFRCQENYVRVPYENYSFCVFNEENCNVGYRKD